MRVINKYSLHNRVRLIRAGSPYFDTLLGLIGAARDTVHLQTYIFQADQTGKLVANALMDAAKRGVQVWLLVDGYGSNDLTQAFIDSLTEAGVHFRFFEPLFKSAHFYFGRRLHQKAVVVDSQYALVGGINIADRYNDIPPHPAWLDFALYVEGPVGMALCNHCRSFWNSGTIGRAVSPCKAKLVHFTLPLENESTVILRRNDWVNHKNEISTTHIEILRSAQTRVLILGAYFLPPHAIRRQMVKAIRRGVNVTVITGGKSDVPLAHHAEQWLYDWLLRHGVTLYEYEKNVLHGKVTVCDDRWLTLGSYNINKISAFASVELNLDAHSPHLAKEVGQTLENIILNDCVQITSEQRLRTTHIMTRFIQWFSYQFIRAVFYLFTFYFKKAS